VVKLAARRAASLTATHDSDIHSGCGPCVMRSMGDANHGCGLTLCWDRLGQFRRYPMGRRLAAVDHAGARSVT
jgi:hypothetical protein